MLRRTGIVSMLALTSYLFCGFASPDGCGPSKGQVVAVGVGVGAVVASAIAIPVVISHNHHTLKGCVITDQNGLQIQQDGDNSKTFTLVGDTPGVKVGDLVKLHGAKKKGEKGSEPTFVVEKITRDYGLCKLPATPTVTTAKS